MSFTLRYTVMLVVLTLIISLVLALLLNSKLKLQGFFRSMYFFPAVLSLITSWIDLQPVVLPGRPGNRETLEIAFLSKNILASSALAPYASFSSISGRV